MNKSVELDVSDNGSNLYIFFGGIAAGIAMPPFEFYNASKIIAEHKLFIRDFSQSWYQNELGDISRDLTGTANYIERQINQLNPDKTFFVGNSMGGYAALMFSSLIGVGEVIAFAPQTFISPLLRWKYKDDRWKEQILRTYKKSLFKKKIWDLKPLLLKQNGYQKRSVYISKEDQLDCIHASHISAIPGVTIHEFESGGHEIVAKLRDEGKLPLIMAGQFSD